MVELKLKVGEKGQILIPKLLREKYGVKKGEAVLIEPTGEGILVKGRPSPEQILEMLRRHEEEVKALGARSPKLGDLQRSYLEEEFEEQPS
jgi:AbrB family looped-hinge helix DNA binding protein